MIKFFTNLTNNEEKNKFLQGIAQSLENEDVIQCLPSENVQCLMEICLRICSLEKITIANKFKSNSPQNSKQIEGKEGKDLILTFHNEITNQIQESLTILLNSRNFTVIISQLLRILKKSLPEDFNVPLEIGKPLIK